MKHRRPLGGFRETDEQIYLIQTCTFSFTYILVKWPMELKAIFFRDTPTPLSYFTYYQKRKKKMRDKSQ